MMRISTFAITVVASLLYHETTVYAFAPSSSFFKHKPRAHRAITKTWSTTSDSSSDIQARRGTAMDALEKLAKQQARELEDTEKLLYQLQNWETTGDDEESFSRATTILSAEDYGFRSRSEGAVFKTIKGGLEQTEGTAFEQYGPPSNIISLGIQQFIRNWEAIKGEYKDEADVVLTPRQVYLQDKLRELTLNSTAIWEREAAEGPIEAPWIILIPYYVLCWFLDAVFEDRYVFSRFFLLETVARMPYFSYINMLHLYETVGFWRRSSDVKRIHFAEEWNEFHHLLIMESLGGDQQWWVRFVAQHSAIMYFCVLCLLWAFSPTLAYKFSELLESHAVNTYGGLLDENEEKLKDLPPSIAAIDYYSLGGSDPLFGEYQTSAIAGASDIRKPGQDMQTLYDVFQAIRADEGDHVGMMQACLDPDVAVMSPSIEKRLLIGIGLAALFGAGADMLSINDLLDSGMGLDGIADNIPTDLLDQVGSMEGQEDLLGLGVEAAEVGAVGVLLESARRALVEGLIKFAEFLITLL